MVINKTQKNKTTEQQPSKLTKGKIAKRIAISFGVVIFCIVFALVSSLFVISYGPSATLRDMLVVSAKQASATKWVPHLFLSKAKVQEIVDSSFKIDSDTIDISDIEQSATTDIWAKNPDGIFYETIQAPTSKAYIMLIKDPSRVKVGLASDNLTAGGRVYDVAKRYNAVAAINGGEFEDIGGMGDGSTPMGLTYSSGNCVTSSSGGRTFIGFDKNNRLVVKNSLSKDKAESLGVRDGVCFKYKNVLINQEGDSVKIHYRNSDNSVAQRTAIGQANDGTVIFVVTDGRTASSIGATYNDVINIMLSYGAVNAGMLDGGSSSVMYYRDYITKYNVDTSKLDSNQKKGIVCQYRAFSEPRKIPTFFIVTEEGTK